MSEDSSDVGEEEGKEAQSARSHAVLENSIRPTRGSFKRKAMLEVPGKEGAANESAPGKRDHRAIPDDVLKRFVRDGNKFHFPDGARAFTDRGARLTSPSENLEVIRSLVSIAQARGWSDITVRGTERFRKEAWFAARLADIEVKGYKPSEYDQGRLIRIKSRGTEERATDEAEQTVGRADSTKEKTKEARERPGVLHTGRLIDHSAAPYRHDPKNSMSYFVRIETPDGEREIWGVDLHRAMKESLTRPQIGDEIGLRSVKRQAVEVSAPNVDAEGKKVGDRKITAYRNGWIVEQRSFFRERAEAARVVRDPRIDPKQAAQSHPQLAGTWLQLHASELASKAIPGDADRRKFLSTIRNALADEVARGEPLPAIRLKERAVPRTTEPAPPSVPVQERDASPAR
jgi:hypothetical protein